jgi:hypothetical protein
MSLGFVSGERSAQAGSLCDVKAWQRGWWHSIIDDPLWTTSWLADIAKKSMNVQATLWTADNPRVHGALSPR